MYNPMKTASPLIHLVSLAEIKMCNSTCKSNLLSTDKVCDMAAYLISYYLHAIKQEDIPPTHWHVEYRPAEMRPFWHYLTKST